MGEEHHSASLVTIMNFAVFGKLIIAKYGANLVRNIV